MDCVMWPGDIMTCCLYYDRLTRRFWVGMSGPVWMFAGEPSVPVQVTRRKPESEGHRSSSEEAWKHKDNEWKPTLHPLTSIHLELLPAHTLLISEAHALTLPLWHTLINLWKRLHISCYGFSAQRFNMSASSSVRKKISYFGGDAPRSVLRLLSLSGCCYLTRRCAAGTTNLTRTNQQVDHKPARTSL